MNKICRFVGKTALVVAKFGLNLHLECNFSVFVGEKTWKFSLQGFLSRVVNEMFIKSFLISIAFKMTSQKW